MSRKSAAKFPNQVERYVDKLYQCSTPALTLVSFIRKCQISFRNKFLGMKQAYKMKTF